MAGSLADTVLPLIRTRADLHRWAASSAHGRQMHEGVDILEQAVDAGDDQKVAYDVTHRALTSAISVIARADDSGGTIGDACRRLLDLHPRAAAAARTPPGRLVDWMIRFQFHGVVDFFELDPVDYQPALGPAGMTQYRGRLDQIRASLPTVPPGADPWDVPGRRERFVLDRNDRRLAVLDHDVDAIIRTHLSDSKLAFRYQETAKALAEIGKIDLAIDWARQGTAVGPRHQALAVADYWCTLLATHRPDEHLPARLDVFRRWPTQSTAAGLYRAAGDTWPTYRDEVLAGLAWSADDLVSFAQHTLGDLPLAWSLAHQHHLDSSSTWDDLATAHQKVDPLATLPIHTRLVEADLAHADAQHYRRAARRLAAMRKLAAGTSEAAHVDAFIAKLRKTHYRRPRLQTEFNRAGLP